MAVVLNTTKLLIFLVKNQKYATRNFETFYIFSILYYKEITYMNQTIRFLADIKDRLEYIDYNLIYQSIADMKDKFVPTAKLNKGWYIDRVRVHKNPEEIFTKEDDISYIHDQEIIDKYVTYGRANAEKQAVFYGAVETDEIKQPRVVAYFETSEILRELEKHDNITEYFTVSRWRVLEDIEIIEMIFSEEALAKSAYTNRSFDHQLKQYAHLPNAKEYAEQGTFFSNEFSRTDVKKGEAHKYKITSAYANYIWNNTGIQGITYPSVQSDFKGQNIALLPNAVDKYLKLETVGLFKFERVNGENLPIDSVKIATDLGADNSNFTWTDYKGADHQPQK
jgi:hypothetical protein